MARQTDSPQDGAPLQAGAFCVLVWSSQNLVALSVGPGGTHDLPILGLAAPGADPAQAATAAVERFTGAKLKLTALATAELAATAVAGRGVAHTVFCGVVADEGAAALSAAWFSVAEIRALQAGRPSAVSPNVGAALEAVAPHLIRIPYLNFSENEYVFRFRTEGQRNRTVYAADGDGQRLYRSALCEAIKVAKRQHERTAETPAVLDFGAVSYVLPSHFGFCLGVQNAIERAYETILQNRGRRVFMISELIHNPFVNEDLKQRGLIYLQSDRGVHQKNPATGHTWWDELEKGDIVLTPAFGATDEDKVRLIERGISTNRYDATCMLVEKVWKAARRFATAGYTVIIHGKHEHEETKATFSNCAKFGPAIVIRDMDEARRLGEVMLASSPAERARLFAVFGGRHTDGFDPERDLDRIAVVNQTTLLRNETLAIIDWLEDVVARKFGAAEAARHLHANSRGDTLCYATQVNQDALERGLAGGADAALVVGGRNSSNTYQLFRICAARFGQSAFYIQSERNILSRDRILHYRFPAKPAVVGAGEFEERPFLPPHVERPRILITGGASCPDGIIQQVIERINGLFPAARLRSVEEVLAEIGAAGA